MLLAALIPVLVPGAARPADEGFYAQTFERRPPARVLSELGRQLFVDPRLSASGRISCASCHDPRAHFGPTNAEPVQRGGRDGRSQGLRAAPSLMYAQNTPPFTLHHVDDAGDDGIDEGPAGGHTWDGRAQSTHDQARLPLLDAREMANANEREVARTLRLAAYAQDLRSAFGEQAFADDGRLLRAALAALEVYQQEAAEFYPYTSKYDAWLRGETRLSAQELRGLAAFNDPARGNCARCHVDTLREGAFPQFTDFGYAALGVPRNTRIAANADPGFFDLGLCGPLRGDLRGRPQYCGMFRTPSLRNVAARPVYFHNGVFSKLGDVLRFYAERDTRPENWYPRGADGRPRQFDDLPAAAQANVDREAPFGRHPGDPPPFTASDIEDMLAFLATLTDGYNAAPRAPALAGRDP